MAAGNLRVYLPSFLIETGLAHDFMCEIVSYLSPKLPRFTTYLDEKFYLYRIVLWEEDIFVSESETSNFSGIRLELLLA